MITSRWQVTLMIRVAAALISVAAPLSAAAPVAAEPSGVVTSDATAAARASSAVTAFRTNLQRTLSSYVNRYGDRLAEAERARVNELIAQADRDLAGVATQAATTTRWAKRGNQAKALASAKSAVRVYGGAFARAEQAIAEIKPILAPRLGFLEAIEAQRDLDAQMTRYRALGTQLRAVVTTLKA